MHPGPDDPRVGPVRRAGDDLLAVAVADVVLAQALAARLRATGDWLEAVAGMASVVAQFDPQAVDAGTAADRLRDAAAGMPARPRPAGEAIEISVVYGGEYGPDLAHVCELTGLSEAAFVARHTAAVHRVDLLGFTPGFAYLDAHPDFDVPRRAEPRPRVAAGAVGIANGRTGLYALPGPGGWHIVGRTPERLFLPEARDPFRLAPGVAVRFRAMAPDEFEDRAGQ
ncbi:MAG: carboxyltransferase domain-containing protein [Woeseiaceae bacterium]|nr:carboxyltransferase domain-containing protein [Woeseiaceae bacterium]